MGRLERKQNELAAHCLARCRADVATLSAPDRVAEQAPELGLAPAAKVHYLMPRRTVAVAEGDTTVAGR